MADRNFYTKITTIIFGTFLVFGFLFSNSVAVAAIEKVTEKFYKSNQTQTTYSLSGRISDPNGSPIAGAKVTAQRKFGGASVQNVTDEKGDFRFENLTNGDYQL
jgi:protocatechuate 3,4-dioxygenase beta subunit